MAIDLPTSRVRAPELSGGEGWLSEVADTNHHAVQVVDLTTGAARVLALAPL